MCGALAKSRNEVRLLAPWKFWRPSTWGKPDAIRGSPYFQIMRLPDFPVGRRWVFDARAMARARRRKVDLVYCRKLSTADAACKNGIRCILELHSMYDVRRWPLLAKAVFESEMLARVVVITDALKADMGSFLGLSSRYDKIRVVRDAVDIDKMEMAEAKVPPRPSVGYFGTVSLAKGCMSLLNLAADLPGVDIHLVGRIDEGMVDALHSAHRENLVVHGAMRHDECFSLMKSMHALVLPNPEVMIMAKGDDIGRYTSPMKMFEYMASGVPIIASRVPAVLEVLDDSCALLVEPNDRIGWREATERILSSPVVASEVAQNALSRVNRYTFESRVCEVLGGLT